MRQCGRATARSGLGAALGVRALMTSAIVMAGVALAVLGVAGPAGATTPTGHPAWKIQGSPNVAVPGGQLEAVSCSSASACTAVGTNVSTTGIGVTLAERWNGTSWLRQRTVNPPSDTIPVNSPDLLAVSCPARNFCEAAGTYQVSTVAISLAERWNGRAWARQSFPVPAGSTSAALNQVSCTSTRFCEAAGFEMNGTGERRVLAATWNGTSWRLQRFPNPPGATFAELGGLSCVSPTFCEATGSTFETGPFAERWNGFSWHRQAMPQAARVGAVSCLSVTFCEAAGGGSGAMWNGSSWSAQTIPSPAGSTLTSLTGVSCVTTEFCQAVGRYNDNSGNSLSLGATWNGSSWALQATPSPAGASFTSLGGVSCTALAACQAVGGFSAVSSQTTALAESWNGASWAIQRAVAPPAATNNDLNEVSCASAAFCEAVGSHSTSSGVTVALAQRWNGASWKIQKVASPLLAANDFRMSLSGVSCASARFCEAVGATANGGGGAEKWNGTSWALQAIPGTSLTSVSCISTRFCLAAGGDGHVDTWNGTTWSTSPSAAGFTQLSSVSCASPRFCEATGLGPAGEAAERWNGTSWSPQVVPTPKGGNSIDLLGVSCAGTRSCELVGWYFSPSFDQVTLAERWNGTAWKVQRTPNPPASPASISLLLGVSCTSASHCTAVGQSSPAIAVDTLAEVWNGTKWTMRSTPSHRYAGQNTLNGVSCTTSHACTAVGVTDDLGQFTATLIETGD